MLQGSIQVNKGHPGSQGTALYSVSHVPMTYLDVAHEYSFLEYSEKICKLPTTFFKNLYCLSLSD